MFLIEPVIFLLITFILDAVAINYKSVFFSSIAAVVPLWDLGQLALTGGSGGNLAVIVTSAWDSTGWHNQTMEGSWVAVVLAIAIIISASVSISMSISPGDKPT